MYVFHFFGHRWTLSALNLTIPDQPSQSNSRNARITLERHLQQWPASLAVSSKSYVSLPVNTSCLMRGGFAGRNLIQLYCFLSWCHNPALYSTSFALLALLTPPHHCVRRFQHLGHGVGWVQGWFWVRSGEGYLNQASLSHAEHLLARHWMCSSSSCISAVTGAARIAGDSLATSLAASGPDFPDPKSTTRDLLADR